MSTPMSMSMSSSSMSSSSSRIKVIAKPFFFDLGTSNGASTNGARPDVIGARDHPSARRGPKSRRLQSQRLQSQRLQSQRPESRTKLTRGQVISRKESTKWLGKHSRRSGTGRRLRTVNQTTGRRGNSVVDGHGGHGGHGGDLAGTSGPKHLGGQLGGQLGRQLGRLRTAGGACAAAFWHPDKSSSAYIFANVRASRARTDEWLVTLNKLGCSEEENVRHNTLVLTSEVVHDLVLLPVHLKPGTLVLSGRDNEVVMFTKDKGWIHTSTLLSSSPHFVHKGAKDRRHGAKDLRHGAKYRRHGAADNDCPTQSWQSASGHRIDASTHAIDLVRILPTRLSRGKRSTSRLIPLSRFKGIAKSSTRPLSLP